MSRGPARRALRPALLLAALLVGVLPAQVAAASVTIHVGDSLSPTSLTIAPGTTVRWVNESDTRHRMRSRNGPVEFDSHNLEPGQSFSFTFTRAGTYPYLDHRDENDTAFHGTIIVRSSGRSGGSGGGDDPAVPNPPSGGGGGAAPASATVHMAGKAFSPSAVTIATGGSVTFLNDDDREHTATGDAFDTGVLNAGSQSRETFGSAGTYSFLCAIHPDMRGTINVRGSSGAGAAPAPATPAPTPTPTPTAPTPPANGDQVASIVDFAFDPGAVEVARGSTVRWHNDGEAPHTVTAGDGSFDSGLIAAGATWARTFATPGTYAFACQFHPEMVGTLVVSEAPVPASASPSTSAAPATSSTTPPAPDFAGVNGGLDEPPAAAIPDEAAPAAFREGALRLLVVAGLVAGAVLAFGFLISGTARGRPGHTRR